MNTEAKGQNKIIQFASRTKNINYSTELDKWQVKEETRKTDQRSKGKILNYKKREYSH